MKDLYGIFADQACQSSMFLFFNLGMHGLYFMFIVNETKVEYKNSIFMTMVRNFCPKKGVMSCHVYFKLPVEVQTVKILCICISTLEIITLSSKV